MSDASLPKLFTTNARNVSRTLQGYEDKKIVGIYEYRPNNVYHEGSILIHNKTLYYVKQHFQSTDFETDKDVLIETYPELLAKDIIFEDEFGVLKYKKFNFPQFKQSTQFNMEIQSESGTVVGNFNINYFRDKQTFITDMNYYNSNYLQPVTYLEASLEKLSYFLQAFDLNTEYELTPFEHTYNQIATISIKFELVNSKIKISLWNKSTSSPTPLTIVNGNPFVASIIHRVYRPIERNVFLFQDDNYANYNILKLVRVSGRPRFISQFQTKKQYSNNLIFKYFNPILQNYFPYTKEIVEGVVVASTVCRAVFTNNSTFQITKTTSTLNQSDVILKMSPIQNFEILFEEKQLENMQQLGELVSDLLDTINSGGGLGGGSDIDTSMVMNKYAEGIVYKEGDVFFNEEDGNPDISIIAPEARLVKFNNTKTKLNNSDGTPVSTVQQAIERIVELIFPVGSYYYQQALDNGTFSDREAPSSLFPNTVWELKWANESVFNRTEGSLSEVERSNGIQGSSIQRITGQLPSLYIPYNTQNGGTSNTVDRAWGGAFTNRSYQNTFKWNNGGDQSGISYTTADSCDLYSFNFDSGYVVASSTETRVVNRLIRIYKRIS